MKELAEHGVDVGPMMSRLGVESGTLADPAGRIPTRTMMAILDRSAVAAANPLLGAQLGHDYRPGLLGLLDYLFLSAATVQDAFETAVRYGSIVAAYGAYRRTVRDGGVGVERTVPAWPGSDQAETFVLGWHLTMARFATGRPVRPLHVGVTQRSSAGVKELAGMFGVPEVELGSGTAVLVLDPADSALPLLGSDPALARVLRRHADLRLTGTASLTDRVRGLLETGMLGSRVDLGSAARELAVSPRTLQQHLQAAGTSWQAELDAARCGRATELLRQGTSTVAAIGRDLGFSDARAFRRAFRRWTGSGPDEYRARGAGAAGGAEGRSR